MRALSPVLCLLLSVPVLAQSTADLSGAETRIKTAVAASRARMAALAERPAEAAAAAAPARPAVALRCRSTNGRTDLTATLSADRKSLENSWSKRSPLIDASKPFVDERCGATHFAPASALNFEVTPPHEWGQDIFQVREQDLDSAAAKFSANLHECSYDGNWSSSDDVELTCERTVPASK